MPDRVMCTVCFDRAAVVGDELDLCVVCRTEWEAARGRLEKRQRQSAAGATDTERLLRSLESLRS